MATKTNKEKTEELFKRCMNEKDYTVVAEVVSPNYMNHTFSNGKAGPESFVEAVKSFHTGFPDMVITQEHVVGDGDLVATQGYWTGTHKGEFMGMAPTGKKVKVEYVDFWRFKNGKAEENWVQMNMPGMMQQLGLAPAGAH